MVKNIPNPRQGLLYCLRSHLLSKGATVDSVGKLLATFANVTNYTDDYFKDILRAAAANGSLEVFKFLEDKGFWHDAYDTLFYMSDGMDYKKDGDYAALFPHIFAHAGPEEGERIRYMLPRMLSTTQEGNYLTVVSKYLSPWIIPPDPRQVLLLSLTSHLLSKMADVSTVERFLATFGEVKNYADEYFKDILRAAAANGSLEVFKYLEDKGFRYDAFDVLVDMSNGRDYKMDGDYVALFSHIIAHAGSEKQERIRRVLPHMLSTIREGNFLVVVSKYLFPGCT